VSLRIAIVGGGLGGLAAALFLRQVGLDAVVYEQAPELREAGAGVVVSPNMVRALDGLGLAHELNTFAVRLEAAWEFRRWQDGRVLFVQPMGEQCERLYGVPCYVAHRADLLQLLRRALPARLLHLDSRCTALHPHGDAVELTLADREGRTSRAPADIAIGADGIHSIVQLAVTRRQEPRFSGLCAFRCLVPADNAPAMALRPVQTHKPTAARFVQAGISRNVGVVIFLEDLSRVQQQAQQLKLASLGRLTANIAHEIRNPLSAINHATELLLEESALRNPSHARLLQIIHDNAQRLDRMVQDVLKLNRRDRAVREEFDLGDYLETFAAEFCEIEKVPAGIIRVEAQVEASISFDRSHLNQIMWNLCRNALRYCQKKPGSIVVSVRPGPRRGTIELDVVDDGMGIAESLRANLFEPFFTTASSGTGLGLYIAREICEANAATLEYVERPVGAQFKLVCKGVLA